MTGNDAPPTAGGDVSGGPPWSLELLADLQAGVFDDETTARLRAGVATDPEASATLAALDRTRLALAGLPPVRMPDEVAARIDAALRAEATARAAAPAHGPEARRVPPPAPAGGPVVDLAAARTRRRRRGLIAGAGLLTAAAATAGVVAVANLTGSSTGGTPAAAPSDQQLPRITVSQNDLGSVVGDALGVHDYGPLDADRLRGCLAANGVAPTVQPLGAREVSLDGRRVGVLMILPAGGNGRLRLLVVSPDCGPGNAATLADKLIG